MTMDPNAVRNLFDPTGEATREAHAHGPVGEAVRAFFVKRCERATRIGDSAYLFHAGELWTWAAGCIGHVAPDTPSRILRLMREAGELDYNVENRAKSRYRILGVRLPDGTVLGEIRP